MKAHEIRKTFIDFFSDKQHKFVPSSPVVPLDDPTLLFANAGMNQFKDVFLAKGKRDYNRAVNSQKCIRVSGKHNDLEEVGPSPNHHTFFEMLGNWSFGDYYKSEAIRWAWELMTEVYGFEKERLYATVYTDDDEAFELWEKETDIDPSHISRHGKKDNFWEMGEVGPCGPCSEIHYDMGKPEPGKISPPDDGPNTESGRFIEIWNLVFIQYYRDETGTLSDLPAKHVDTGAGLERIARVLQGVDSNYETDIFYPLIEAISERTGVPYLNDRGDYSTPHRVISDHIRSLSFAIADGALPGNEGRGYVLRRILRRAARFSRELGISEPMINELVPVLVEQMGDHFGEIKERAQHIQHVIKAEEESFGRTLDRGLETFAILTKDLQEGSEIPGEAAFKLYDTYGFPLDLTELMARERGLVVDTVGFDKALEFAKARSRESARSVTGDKEFTVVSEGSHSEYVGYTKTNIRTSIRMVRIIEGKLEDANNPSVKNKPRLELVLEKTPFYAEAGGQVSDHGFIRGSKTRLVVDDVYQEGDFRVHSCLAYRLPEDGTWPGQVEAHIDEVRRGSILPHHTTTHLLQAALRKTLGDHVTQAGSKVTPDYMTFDFTHFEKVSSAHLHEIEAQVNAWIRENHSVADDYSSIDEAKSRGAMALFGEKYGDIVRTIQIGDGQVPVSLELCGGTHLTNTGEAGLFRIETESAVSAGVRRIEATAGEAAYNKAIHERSMVRGMSELLGSGGSNPVEKLEKNIERQKELEKEIDRLKKAALQGSVNFISDWGQELNYNSMPIMLISGHYEAAFDRDNLQSVGDKITDDLKKEKKEGIGLIGALIDETFMFVAVVTPELVKTGVNAGKLVGAFAKKAGGGGGGKPSFATAGSKDHERAKALINNRSEVFKFVQSFLDPGDV